MRSEYFGWAFLAFGIAFGGLGVAGNAGGAFGIGVPMIPIGIYLLIRGYRQRPPQWLRGGLGYDQPLAESEAEFEETKVGRIALGGVLLLAGLGSSGWLIGLPILGVGIWLIYSGSRSSRPNF